MATPLTQFSRIPQDIDSLVLPLLVNDPNYRASDVTAALSQPGFGRLCNSPYLSAALVGRSERLYHMKFSKNNIYASKHRTYNGEIDWDRAYLTATVLMNVTIIPYYQALVNDWELLMPQVEVECIEELMTGTSNMDRDDKEFLLTTFERPSLAIVRAVLQESIADHRLLQSDFDAWQDLHEGDLYKSEPKDIARAITLLRHLTIRTYNKSSGFNFNVYIVLEENFTRTELIAFNSLYTTLRLIASLTTDDLTTYKQACSYYHETPLSEEALDSFARDFAEQHFGIIIRFDALQLFKYYRTTTMTQFDYSSVTHSRNILRSLTINEIIAVDENTIFALTFLQEWLTIADFIPYIDTSRFANALDFYSRLPEQEPEQYSILLSMLYYNWPGNNDILYSEFTGVLGTSDIKSYQVLLPVEGLKNADFRKMVSFYMTTTTTNDTAGYKFLYNCFLQYYYLLECQPSVAFFVNTFEYRLPFVRDYYRVNDSGQPETDKDRDNDNINSYRYIIDAVTYPRVLVITGVVTYNQNMIELYAGQYYYLPIGLGDSFILSSFKKPREEPAINIVDFPVSDLAWLQEQFAHLPTVTGHPSITDLDNLLAVIAEQE